MLSSKNAIHRKASTIRWGITSSHFTSHNQRLSGGSSRPSTRTGELITDDMIASNSGPQAPASVPLDDPAALRSRYSMLTGVAHRICAVPRTGLVEDAVDVRKG